MMASLLNATVSKFSELWEYRDRRIDSWLLMNSPIPSMIISLTYFYVVKIGGPKFMEKRPPFELRRVMMVYNLFQVAINCWLVYVFGHYGWFSGNYSYTCQPVDYSYNDSAIRILRACYLYYMLKLVDLLDTVFFVLRKKNNQITWLHVIHHGLLPTILWPGVRFACGGHGTFFQLLNSFVHILMYFYYFVAAFGPKFQKYLVYKQYLTNIQIIQFIAVGIHISQLFFIECDFPIVFVWLIASNVLIFLFLFFNFYVQSYLKKGRGKDAHRKEHVKNQ